MLDIMLEEEHRDPILNKRNVRNCMEKVGYTNIHIPIRDEPTSFPAKGRDTPLPQVRRKR
jgi:hypothetical protein